MRFPQQTIRAPCKDDGRRTLLLSGGPCWIHGLTRPAHCATFHTTPWTLPPASTRRSCGLRRGDEGTHPAFVPSTKPSAALVGQVGSPLPCNRLGPTVQSAMSEYYIKSCGKSSAKLRNSGGGTTVGGWQPEKPGKLEGTKSGKKRPKTALLTHWTNLRTTEST